MDEINLKLIDLVKRSPAIFDKTNLYYSNKEHVKLVWLQISNEMQLTVPVCQKRWRYLRDYFVRQLHIGQNENKKSTWALFDTLTFLTPFSTTRKTRSDLFNHKRKYNYSNLDGSDINKESDNEFNGLDYLNFYRNNYGENSISTSIPMDSSLVSSPGTAIPFKFSSQIQKTEVSPALFHNDNSNGSSENLSNLIKKDPTTTDDGLSYINLKKLKLSDHRYNFLNNNNSYMKTKSKAEILNELLEIIKNSNQDDEPDEHFYFFKSILSSVRNIDQSFILRFRTEILEILTKYHILSQQKRIQDRIEQENKKRDSNTPEVVVVETGELNWRNKLNKY